MSDYRTNPVDMKRIRLENALSECQSMLEGLSEKKVYRNAPLSMALMECALMASRPDTKGVEVAKGDALKMAKALSSPSVNIGLSNEVKNLLSAAASQMSACSTPSSIQASISSALLHAANERAVIDRKSIIGAMNAAFTELGYKTQVAYGKNSAAIQAMRGHEVRVVGIDENFVAVRDGAGLSGKKCHDTDKAIVDAFKRHGVYLGPSIEDKPHGESGGGALLRELSRNGGSKSNLAKAYVSRVACPSNSMKTGTKNLFSNASVASGTNVTNERI